MRRYMNGLPKISISPKHITKKASYNQELFPIEGMNGVDFVLDKNRIMLLNTKGYIIIPKKKIGGVIEELQQIKEVYLDE